MESASGPIRTTLSSGLGSPPTSASSQCLLDQTLLHWIARNLPDFQEDRQVSETNLSAPISTALGERPDEGRRNKMSALIVALKRRESEYDRMSVETTEMRHDEDTKGSATPGWYPCFTSN